MNITPVSPLQKSVETKREKSLSVFAKLPPDIVTALLSYLRHREMFRFSVIERSISLHCKGSNKILHAFRRQLSSCHIATRYVGFEDALRCGLSASICHLNTLDALARNGDLRNALIQCPNLEFLNFGLAEPSQALSLAHVSRCLKAINFEYSEITNANLVPLQNLPSLEFVDFTSCKKISAAAFFLLPLSIRALKLQNSKIENEDLALLSRFPLLVSLDLSYCGWLIKDGLENLPPTIQSLTVDSIGFADNALASLSHLTSLESISLRTNSWICGSGLIHLPHSVRSIVLDYSPSITDLSHLPPQLTALSVQRCELTDTVLRFFDISSVKFINLSMNSVSEIGLSHLPKTIKVRHEKWPDYFHYPWFQYDRSRA